jgi:alpha-galactosidase
VKQIIARKKLGDMLVLYPFDTNKERIGLCIVPESMEEKINLNGDWNVESLVQIKLIEDPYPEGSYGTSLRNSRTTEELTFREQYIEKKGNEQTIVTVLESRKLKAWHRLTYLEGSNAVTISTEVRNHFGKEITIEMIESFSLCGIPMPDDEVTLKDCNLYRMYSNPYIIGKLKCECLSNRFNEITGKRSIVQSKRFGQVATMPCGGYLPWGVIEDTRNHICTGALVMNNGSWQMEIYKRDGRISFAGGLGDLENSHWKKSLRCNENFVTSEAIVTTVNGDVEAFSERILQFMQNHRFVQPKWEEDMPIIYNDFYTVKGNPSETNVRRILNELKGKGIMYYVIDAGWCSKILSNYQSGIGDWKVNRKQFPGGLKAVTEEIRKAGMIPGIWFEPEVACENSRMFYNEEFLLKRNGIPVTAGIRRFLDFRKLEVINYLSNRLIHVLKECDFGYLKIDCKESIGTGCDGADSLGEGLSENTQATLEFYRKVRNEIPDLVMEVGSLGGCRLEPTMIEMASLISLTNDPESVSIAIIAANIERTILPTQCLIPAIIRSNDNLKRITYSIVNTFLGRMCLSGDVLDLSEEQWEGVSRGMQFYESVKYIIRDGESKRYGSEIECYDHPEGWQAVLRDDKELEQILIVVHQFEGETDKIVIPLPDYKAWHIEQDYTTSGKTYQINERNELEIIGLSEYDAAGIWLV